MLFSVCLCVAGCKKNNPQTESAEPTASSSAAASTGSVKSPGINSRLVAQLRPEVVEQLRSGSPTSSGGAGFSDVPQQCEKMCKLTGRCVAEGSKRCIATSKEHCLSSFGCKVMGACSLDEKQGCSALTKDDCAGSEICQFKGACIPVNGKCSNGSDQNAVSMPPSSSK